ncbi:hypothetical protein APY04_0784 [Hyphomicrobium sulfonivorans]|uniref:Uncharacterized protein n=1 Tax=Hyphomicrobium sulfonivorans TaxID=121290 RepID=A0A120CXB6_HYPSL|nr:hypothetical protein [Hyphomicrobium sulfonivorans]KWT70723.1 hypothetical protein APY04_0784 [Hyphomicrobium sulfonivorans]
MWDFKHWMKNALSQKAVAEIKSLKRQNSELRTALEAYEAFHTRMFSTGRPLQQNGAAIDHRDLNEAHSLATRALNAAQIKGE